MFLAWKAASRRSPRWAPARPRISPATGSLSASTAQSSPPARWRPSACRRALGRTFTPQEDVRRAVQRVDQRRPLAPPLRRGAIGVGRRVRMDNERARLSA
jgi:hypothetical protein